MSRGTPFQIGNPGKQPGTQNKLTRTVREVFLKVFNELQEDPKTELKAFAIAYPEEFHRLVSKLIPTEVKADLQVTQTILRIERKTGNDFIEDITPESSTDSEGREAV